MVIMSISSITKNNLAQQCKKFDTLSTLKIANSIQKIKACLVKNLGARLASSLMVCTANNCMNLYQIKSNPSILPIDRCIVFYNEIHFVDVI